MGASPWHQRDPDHPLAVLQVHGYRCLCRCRHCRRLQLVVPLRSYWPPDVLLPADPPHELQSFFLLMMYILLPVCTRSVDTKTHAVLASSESVCPVILKALFGHMPYKGPPLYNVWPVKFVEI